MMSKVLLGCALLAVLAVATAQFNGRSWICEQTTPVDQLEISKLGGEWFEISMINLTGYTAFQPRCSVTKFNSDFSVSTSFFSESEKKWRTISASLNQVGGTGQLNITYKNIVSSGTEYTMPFNVLRVDYNDFVFIYGCWGGGAGFPDTTHPESGTHEVAWFLSRTREPTENAILALKKIRYQINLVDSFLAPPLMLEIDQKNCTVDDLTTSPLPDAPVTSQTGGDIVEPADGSTANIIPVNTPTTPDSNSDRSANEGLRYLMRLLLTQGYLLAGFVAASLGVLLAALLACRCCGPLWAGRSLRPAPRPAPRLALKLPETKVPLSDMLAADRERVSPPPCARVV